MIFLVKLDAREMCELKISVPTYSLKALPDSIGAVIGGIIDFGFISTCNSVCLCI